MNFQVNQKVYVHLSGEQLPAIVTAVDHAVGRCDLRIYKYFRPFNRTVSLSDLKERVGPTTFSMGPNFSKVGQPIYTARAFDETFLKTGKLPDRSFAREQASRAGHYHAIEFCDEEEFISVLVMGDGRTYSHGNSRDPRSAYYGVNVIFFPDGTVDFCCGDQASRDQWFKDKEKIIQVARQSLSDKDLPGIYDGLCGRESKRGSGKLSFDVKPEE